VSGVAVDATEDRVDTEGVVSKMLARMAHRGPDGSASATVTRVDARATVGQLSLWATTEDVGLRGPLEGPRGHLLAFDGRLDEREVLARELDAPPAAPDRDLALRAFERWGRDAPKHLTGDFAWAVWCPDEKRLFAARDRMGTAPLFYARTGRGIRVASEKRALLVDGRVAPRPNLLELSLALADEHVERDGTWIEGVCAIPPGSWLEWTPERFIVEGYHRLAVGRRVTFTDPRDYVVDLEEVLAQAVRDRLRARRAVGATVSGGLDSSTVAALASREASAGGLAAPRLVTVRYPGLSCDEGWFSERLARHLEAPLAAVPMPTGGESYAPRDVGDLLYDPTVGVYEAMARALDGVRVMLTGWGSDELQWPTGYEVQSLLGEGHPLSALRVAGAIEEPLRARTWRRFASAVARVVRLRPTPPAPGERDDVPACATDRAVELLRQGRRARAETLGWLRDQSPTDRVVVGGLVHGLQAPFGLGHMGMIGAALGIELRHPFFDVRVVERFLSYPLALRYDAVLDKPLLRRTADRWLPPSLAWRTLRPSFAPFFRFAAEAHAVSTRKILAGARLEALGLVREGYLKRAAQECDTDARLRELGTLLTLESWLARLET
jgi:asparagine synthase (glutamine-hydrolysing)